MEKLVRLKPHDPKRGHVIRRYTAFGTRFDERKGWYRVPTHVADYLDKVRQVPDDAYAPKAFDVCTEEEARTIDAAEKRREDERARPAEAHVVPPPDLPEARAASSGEHAGRAGRGETRSGRRG